MESQRGPDTDKRASEGRVSVLISSFDGYSDCWLPVCHGFTKYWSDCPYPIYLMTNHKDFHHPPISVLKVGEDTGWSGRMLTALARLQTRYILYFQEDYWIMAPVETQLITGYVDLMEAKGFNYLRLVSSPQPEFDLSGDARLGLLAPTAPYRTSVQISLWRRETLLDLLRPGETVWQFEINGSLRSQKYGDTFVSTRKRGADDYAYGIRYLCTAVNSGKWYRAAKVYARNEGLAVDFTRLPSETWWHDFRRSGALGAAAGRWEHRIRLFISHPVLAARKLVERLGSPRKR